MSFANKFSFKKKDVAAKPGEEGKAPETKPRARVKQHPLLNAKHGKYVDDSELFTPKITRQQRLEYWQHILSNRGKRQIPKGFKTWMSKEIETESEMENYPLFNKVIFNMCSNRIWDQISLNLFIIFAVFVIADCDGWAELYFPDVWKYNFNNQLLALPVLLIFICQCFPAFGMWYCTHYCNDLVLFFGTSNIQRWAFCAALIVQYVEYFYYGGRDRRISAGNCRFGHSPNENSLTAYTERYIQRLRTPKVHPEEGGDEEEEEGGGDDDQDDEHSQNDDAKDKSKSSGGRKKSITSNNGDSTKYSAGSDEEKDGDENETSDLALENGPAVEETPVEHMQWTCIVCNTENNRPKHTVVESDMIFGTKGVFYQRTYAVIQPRRDIPTCTKCMTYADYAPPKGSAHLFPNNPHPHAAFEEYPKQTTVPAGLKIDENSIYISAIKSFFFGLTDSVTSTPILNDWQLRKYVMDQYPEIPRPVLRDSEFYKVGEIVECKMQKFDYCRARIVVTRANHSYDICYDAGDELRFVMEADIRFRPEKGAYAYRVELGMVALALLLPLGLFLALLGNFGLIFIGPFLVCLCLLLVRIVNFVQHFYNFYAVGMCTLLRSSGLLSLPLLFGMISGAIALGITTAEAPEWSGVAVLMILAMIFSLPVLYMMRPPFALIGGVVFLQVTIGGYMMAMFMIGLIPYAAYPMVPLVTTALCLKFVRFNLHTIWDVCVIIRPEVDISVDNPSILEKLREDVEEMMGL